MQMVSQLMSRGNEVAQVREEMLQKMLTFDQKMDEVRTEGAATSKRIATFENRMDKVHESERRIQHVEHAISGHFISDDDADAEAEEAEAVAAAAAVAAGTNDGTTDDAVPERTVHEKVQDLHGINNLLRTSLRPVDRSLLVQKQQLDSLQEQMANITLEIAHLGQQRPRSPGGINRGAGADAATVKLLEARLEEMEKRMVGMEESATRGAEKTKSLEDTVKVLSMELAAIKARPVAVASKPAQDESRGGSPDMGPWLQQQAEHMAKENAKVISDVQSLRDQLRSLNKRVDGSADKQSVTTVAEDVEGFKRQLHGRMLSLSSVQSSTGKQVDKLATDVAALGNTTGGLQGTAQEVSWLSRGFDNLETRMRTLASDAEQLASEVHDKLTPAVSSIDDRVSAAEEEHRKSSQTLKTQAEEIRKRAKLSQLAELERAVQSLLQMVQGGMGKSAHKGKAAAGSYRCIVCDSSLDDLSKNQPWSRDGFQPTATLTPELFFDGTRSSTGARRPPSARSARAASPPEQERLHALHHGRQPPGPGAVGAMEVARGTSGARRARPQSAGPAHSQSMGPNPRGHHRPIRPSSALPTRAPKAPSPSGLLPGEGQYVRTGSESPPGTGAANPPVEKVEEGQGGQSMAPNYSDESEGGWREENYQAAGPYAVREVYGV